VIKRAVLLECIGKPAAGKAFLLEYQKAVLYTLRNAGLIDQFQLEECIRKLISQCS